ncbi:unnamed protein product [Rhizophagus irregularis]|nr:unnamed protein product [Rhizophagus irregularis]
MHSSHTDQRLNELIEDNQRTESLYIQYIKNVRKLSMFRRRPEYCNFPDIFQTLKEFSEIYKCKTIFIFHK